jgi:SAM-dependent methyltransferase
MERTKRWLEAHHEEKTFWDGMARDEHSILRVLAANAEKVPEVRAAMPAGATSALEIGVGPFGLGVIGFLTEIPQRVTVEPLAPVPISAGTSQQVELRDYIGARRQNIQNVLGYGEELPLKSESMDLVICCNVIDHSHDPGAILREVHRVLKPNGVFYFDVDTFSAAGLMKWHTWTKHRHKNEILVIGHPYRMRESDIERKLRETGFQLKRLRGHTFTSNLIGHARDSTFLGTKCRPS